MTYDEFTLKVELGNEAMQTPEDVAGVLERVAADLRERNGSEWHLDAGTERDLNGNTVVAWEAK